MDAGATSETLIVEAYHAVVVCPETRAAETPIFCNPWMPPAARNCKSPVAEGYNSMLPANLMSPEKEVADTVGGNKATVVLKALTEVSSKRSQG